jgi:hypothetical protein
MTHAGTITYSVENKKFFETGFTIESKTVFSLEAAEELAKRYNDAHRKAIEVNEETLRVIKELKARQIEILSTDRFTGYRHDKSVWLVRDGKEKVVVTSHNEIKTDDRWVPEWNTPFYPEIPFKEAITRLREAGYEVTVKQVEPQWPLVTRGNQVESPDGQRWLVAIIEPGKFGLVSLKDGARWSDPISYGSNPNLIMSLKDLVNRNAYNSQYVWKLIK